MNTTVMYLMPLLQCCICVFCISAHSNTITYAVEGKSVILLCPLWSTTSVVSWTGPQNLTYSINGVVNENILYSHKISVVGNNEKGEYNMLIERLVVADFGLYQCESVVNGTFAVHDIFLQKADQPKLADNKSSYIHFAEHGKPTRIQISVGSYEIPSVAWTTNPGGKVGLWNVQNISAALYQISSEVIPTSTFHYGVYGIRVRNSIGRLNLEVEITSVLVYLLPQHTSCNISSQITLVCTVKAKNSSELSNEWVHVRDNTVLRSLKGHIKGSTSKLSVHYCDYRDAGRYICKWSTKEKVYSNQSTVLVEGQPVFAEANVEESSSKLQMQVFFYSVPSPRRAIWFFKDRLVQNDSDNLQTISSKRISIDIHKTHVSVYGFVASLETEYQNYSVFKLFSCQIQNTYGILDISFSDMRFSDPTLLNGKYTRKGILGRKSDNKTKDDNDMLNKKDSDIVQTYLYSSGIATFAVVILIMSAVVIRCIALRRKVFSTEGVAAHDREGFQAEPNDDQLSNQTYEEVENVSYQSVEWRIYDLDMQSAENESINLQEIQEQHYENESDTRCYEGLLSSNRAPNEYVIIESNLEERSKSGSELETEL